MRSDGDAAPKGSLDRALQIFEVLTMHGKATTAELVEAVGVSRSAMYRLVERLQASEYLTLSEGHWRLGPAVARMAMAAVGDTDVLTVAAPLLRELARHTGETASLGVLSGDEIVLVFREIGHHAVHVRSELGARRPLHATSVGKAYLAGLAPDQCEAHVKELSMEAFTAATNTDRDLLLKEIIEARTKGWTEEHGEFDPASSCYGAPVFDQSGKVTAAVSLAGPSPRMNDRTFGPLVARTAASISNHLGHTAPTRP